MFDDHTCMAFLLSFFFLSLLNRCQYVLFLSLILFFFAEQMLYYGMFVGSTVSSILSGLETNSLGLNILGTT